MPSGAFALFWNLTYSDNVGANILLDVVGMQNVNATMQRLGFSSTHFTRRLMDTEAERRGLENMTSARDIGGDAA